MACPFRPADDDWIISSALSNPIALYTVIFVSVSSAFFCFTVLAIELLASSISLARKILEFNMNTLRYALRFGISEESVW